MKSVALVCWMLLPNVLSAQMPVKTVVGSANAERVTKVVRVRYGNARALAQLAGTGLQANINADDALRAIVVAGAPAAVDAVEQTIHELDVPASVPIFKDVEVTVSVLGASAKPGPSQQSEVPDNLAPVIKQISAIFPYKNYHLLSSMLLRSREGGKSESQGLIQGVSSTDAAYLSPYRVAYDEANVSSAESKPTLHLRNFSFTSHARVQSGAQTWNSEISLQTDVDLHEGEKVVVGKANTGDSDAALFVIVSARVVD